MKTVFFTHSYFLRFDPKQWATGQPYAPLGTLYAAAWLRLHGYTISFFDTMFAEGPEAVQAPVEAAAPAVFVIYDDGFNYLTKMCLENMRNAAFEMIRIAKAKGCTVIVSSSDSTDHFDTYLHAGADFILLGEAEQTLLALCNALATDQPDFFGIEGLAFTSNGAVVKTGRRSVLKDLDSLPFPAWDIIDMTPYQQMWYKHAGYFSINMATTRGCPFKCNWCAKHIYGNRYNSRSPQRVIEEIKMLQDEFACEHIWFCDDIFGLKPGWVKAFADLVGQEEL